MGFLTAAVIAGTAAVGIGTIGQMNAAKEQGEAQQKMIQEEQKQEALRRRAQELDSRRRTMEMVRTQQRARAASLATTTAQGASTGSALEGAYGQAAGQTGVNMLGVQQNYDIGSQMFASNLMLSNQRMAYANAGTDKALWGGVSQLGATLVSNAGQINSLGKQAMAWSPYGTGWGNGVPQGRGLGGYGGSWG